MPRLSRLAMALACTLALLVVAGCAGVSVQSKQFLGLPSYPPSDPASVQILRDNVARPHQNLGEITLIPDSDVPVQKIEAKLREAAARMGADAAVIVSDRERPVGLNFPRREIRAAHERLITATAIKFTDR